MAGVIPIHLPPSPKGDNMTVLRTVAQQIYEFGSFLYTFTVDDKTIADVYRIDKSTNAQIYHTGNNEVNRVIFTKA